MKSIYNILIAGILCLLVNTGAFAQYEATPGQGAETAKYSDNGCYCNFINDWDQMNTALNLLAASKREAWLREREAVIKDELDKRFKTTFSSFAEAQKALFTSMTTDFKEVESVLSVVKENAKYELEKKKREGDKHFYESKTLGHRIKEIDDGINGNASQIGDLKTAGFFIKNLNKPELIARRNQTVNDRWKAYNLMAKNGRILDGLPKITNNFTLKPRIINAYIENYNGKNIEQRVKAMLKYMIRHNLHFGNDLPFYQDTNIFHPNNSHLVGKFSEIARNQGTYHIDIPEVTPEEEIKRYAISKLGDKAFDFIIPKKHIKNAIGEYLKYHRYKEFPMGLAKDIFKHYGDGRLHQFPHDSYDYSLDTGSLFSIDYQDVDNKNRLFQMENHNAHQFKKFNGLGNILSSLSQLPRGLDRDEIFIGDFMIEILKDNGTDMSATFTGQQAFTLFHFRAYEYQNLGRYNIGVDFNGFRGTTLWNNKIRFPSLLNSPKKTAIVKLLSKIHLQENRIAHLSNVNEEAAIGLYEFIMDNSTGYNNSVTPTEISSAASEIATTMYLFGQGEAAIDKIESIIREAEPVLALHTERAVLMMEIVRMNKYLKTHGYRPLAEYIDNVIPTLPGFSNNDLYNLYSFVWKMHKRLKAEYMIAIYGTFSESVKPMIEIALFEIGGTATLKLLEKLPEVIKTTEVANIITNLRSTSLFGNLRHGKAFGIETYSKLNEILAALNLSKTQLGIQVHHLFEKRFALQLGVTNTNNMKSIVLTIEEHQAFTNAWRRAIGYGTNPGTSGFYTSNAPRSVIESVAREIYKDYPEILIALGL